MLRIARRVSHGTPSEVLSLPYDERKKSRLRARAESGREVAIVLERGSMLRDGDLLAADGGEIVVVRAAEESVSDVSSADALLLTRAAYHLGNRHVPLQLELGGLRYQHDHVLDQMVRALGLEVVPRMAAFEPESGAYARGHVHGSDVDAHGEHEHPHPHLHSHGHSPRGGDS
jgi:urease accessory protein